MWLKCCCVYVFDPWCVYEKVFLTRNCGVAAVYFSLWPFVINKPCHLKKGTCESRSWAQVPAVFTGRNSEERNTPSPIDPEAIEVDINFQPDPTDLVLSSVPGGELFNPRKHKFSEDELKPQPMIKKAKKIFVPDDQKVACCSNTNIINLSPFHPVLRLRSPRMTNTGPGERRTTWQPNVLVTPEGWRRTRSQCAPPSWNGRTPRCGSRWPSCGRTAAAARTSWPGMRRNTAHCKKS